MGGCECAREKMMEKRVCVCVSVIERERGSEEVGRQEDRQRQTERQEKR